MRAPGTGWALVALGLGWPLTGHAQQGLGTAGVGAEVQYFSFSDAKSVNMESLSLVTLPFGASVGVGTRLVLGVSGFWARGERRKSNGESLTVQGPTDTQLSATLALGQGRVSLAAVVALPTGHSEHSQDEEDISANIATDLLPFRISNWGSGGGAGVRAIAAERFGGVGAGLSVGYFVAQEFSPRAWEATVYRPGSNLVIRGVLDGNVGRAGRAALQLSFHAFGDDLLDGAGFYRSGNRLQAIGSYAFAVGRRSSGMVYVGGMYRAEGEEIQGLPPIGAKTLFLGGAGARVRIGGTLLIPTIDLRLLRAEDGVDQGVNVRLGTAAELGVGSTLLVPFARVHVGRLAVIEDISESSYVGFDLGLGVRFGGAR